MNRATLPLLLTCFAVASMGQAGAKKDYSADTKTVESTVATLYDVISGPAGQARDWNRFKNLFAEGARMVPTIKQADGVGKFVLTPDDYVTRAGPILEKEGFFEKEIGSKIQKYGPIAQVFTAYESRKTPTDEKPIERGVNSLQLTFDGKRWWIESITWAGDGIGGPIPDDLIKK